MSQFHPRPFGRARSVRLIAIAVLVQAAAVAAVATPAWATTTELAASSPAGLIQSTANLYWTSNTTSTQGGQTVYTSSVWRASKSNMPGQETLLYQETGTKPVSFGAIKWAEVDGAYNAYFVANYAGGVSKIKEVSLSGGDFATTLKKSPAEIGDRDLVTDGTHLFWADAKGIREMPIGGGMVKTLAKGTTFQAVALDSKDVYYGSIVTGTDGYGQGDLNEVPIKGGKSSVLVQIPDTDITALDTLQESLYTEYYIGTANATVEEGTTIGGVTDVLQQPSVGTTITSLSRDATNGDILWGEDDFLQGVNSVVWDTGGSSFAVVASAAPVGVQGDGSEIYWGDQHLEATTF
jgi:hypothetical protein